MHVCSLVENSLSKLFNFADFLDIIITILSYVPERYRPVNEELRV